MGTCNRSVVRSSTGIPTLILTLALTLNLSAIFAGLTSVTDQQTTLLGC